MTLRFTTQLSDRQRNVVSLQRIVLGLPSWLALSLIRFLVVLSRAFVAHQVLTVVEVWVKLNRLNVLDEQALKARAKHFASHFSIFVEFLSGRVSTVTSENLCDGVTIEDYILVLMLRAVLSALLCAAFFLIRLLMMLVKSDYDVV